MTAQLTHETRRTSIAQSTTSFPIIWCAGHLPAQNNDCHMFYQKLLLCINDGPVIVTGMNSVIHHISHKREWTKPLNESTILKIHIGTGTESHLQRSSFDSVHFLDI